MELGENGWQKLNIAADPAIDSTQLKNRETHVLKLFSAQFIKAWEIIRERKIEKNLVAQATPEQQMKEDQPQENKPASQGWHSDNETHYQSLADNDAFTPGVDFSLLEVEVEDELIPVSVRNTATPTRLPLITSP